MHRLTTRLVFPALAALVVIAMPAIASAGDFLVEPFFAWSRNPPTAGTTDTAGWHPGGGVGVNWLAGALVAGGDFGYASGFFDPKPPASDLIQTSQLLTVSGTVGVTRPSQDGMQRLLPYVTGGAGLLRQQARDRAALIDVTRNDMAVNVGGGVRYLITRYIGVTGDVRYFVDLKKPFDQPSDLTADIGRLTFWRVAAGVVLRFGD